MSSFSSSLSSLSASSQTTKSSSTELSISHDLMGNINPESACSLRIVLINDVYELDNLPNFKVARSHQNEAPVVSTGQSRPDLCIAVIAGDFLAPSMLSSVDKGVGMIDCLNKSGIDYCCIGNHEGDLVFNEFCMRVEESKFTWINSNIPGLCEHSPILSRQNMPEYVILDVVSKDKSHIRRVALIGLCCEDTAVLMPNAFKNCIIEPLNAKAAELYQKLIETEGVDTIIPMTHQFVFQDRELASNKIGFPVILGGHDHLPYLEIVESCAIIKTGSNADNFGIIDITWETKSSPTFPLVTAVLQETKIYSANTELEAVVKHHKFALDKLNGKVLFSINPDDGNDLSSVGMRLGPTTMGAFLCSIVREELKTECALVGGGCIRANRNYIGESNFTYAHLKSELPFDTTMIVLHITGSLICEIIEYTRQFALSSPPIEKGAFFQTDDKIEWDRDTNKVTKINGLPVQLDKIYRCAINYNTIIGMDDVIPLLEFKKQCKEGDKSGIHKSDEYAFPIKSLIVRFFNRDKYESFERLPELFMSPCDNSNPTSSAISRSLSEGFLGGGDSFRAIAKSKSMAIMDSSLNGKVPNSI